MLNEKVLKNLKILSLDIILPSMKNIFLLQKIFLRQLKKEVGLGQIIEKAKNKCLF